MNRHVQDYELDAAEEVYDRRHAVAKAVFYWSSGFIMSTCLYLLPRVFS